jgi:hypothetical protein
VNIRDAAWLKKPEVNYPEVAKEYPLASVIDKPRRQPVSKLAWFVIAVIVAAIYCLFH